MKTLTQLKRESEKLRNEIHKRQSAARKKESQKLVGKCFKYRNSYGSGEDWWLYTKITGVGDHWPECFQFQRTSLVFEVRPNDLFTNACNHSEITPEEYDEAWANFVAEFLASKP